MAQTFNYPLNLASGIASTVSSIFIPTNATIGNVFYNTLTVGNMLSNNLNLGSCSMFSGSFSASNNQVSPANVTGLIFNSSNINYFECILTVNITTSVPSTLNAVYTIRGNFNASGWAIAASFIGDITGITFTINSVTGQISYTSTNISFWTSNIFRYRVEQITNTGTYTSLIAGATTSNYSFSTLQILSTTDALPNNNIGALSVSGGVTIAKELFVGGSSFFNTAGSLGINTTNISYALDVNGTSRNSGLDIGGTQPNFSSNTIGELFITGTTSTISGPHLLMNTSQDQFPTLQILNYAHDNIGLLFDNYWDGNFITSNISAFQMYKIGNQLRFNYATGSAGSSKTFTTAMVVGSTGNIGVGTATPRINLEIVGTSSTTGMMLYSGTNDNGVNRIIFNHSDDSSNFQKVQIQTQALGTSQFAKANFAICLNTATNTANATFADSKFFISGSSGNVGINTTSPSFTLDVNGTGRVTNSIIIGSNNSGSFPNQSISSNTNYPMAFSANAGSLSSFIFGSSGLSTNYLTINNVASGYTLDVNGTIKSTNSKFYATGSTFVNTTSTAVLPFNTIRINIGNNYNSSTYTYTAPVAGTYFFAVQVQNTYANTNNAFQIMRNGTTEIAYSETVATNYNINYTYNVQTMVTLSVNDTVTANWLFGSVVTNSPSYFMGYLMV